MRAALTGLALGVLFAVILLTAAAAVHLPLLWPAKCAIAATYAALGLVCGVVDISADWRASGALLGLLISSPLAFMVILIGMNVTPRFLLAVVAGSLIGVAINGFLATRVRVIRKLPDPSLSRALWILLAVALAADAAFVGIRYRLPVIPIRERVTAGEYNDENEGAHIARYRFARQFCRGKKIADIASGTGYGMKILAETASSVDGYDIAPLGQQYVLDLEKSGWTKHYDVIVSFETIEHLANPDFFLANVQRTTDLLVLSTPLWESRGDNPFHKQFWTFDSISQLLEKRFSCRYLFQDGETIAEHVRANTTLIALCTPTAAQ